MKKILGLLLLCALCITVVGCGKEEVKDDVYDESLSNEDVAGVIADEPEEVYLPAEEVFGETAENVIDVVE